ACALQAKEFRRRRAPALADRQCRSPTPTQLAFRTKAPPQALPRETRSSPRIRRLRSATARRSGGVQRASPARSPPVLAERASAGRCGEAADDRRRLGTG